PAWSAYQVFASTRITGTAELTTYWSGVPAIGASFGAPSKLVVKLGPLTRATEAVCGIELAISASCACGVPRPPARPSPAGESGGMFAKSAGRLLPGT